MGCCCCSEESVGTAFQSDMRLSLLNDGVSQIPPNAFCVTLFLESIKNLPIGDNSSFGGSTNSFVEVRLVPGEKNIGEQLQRSFMRPQNLNPEWEPPERFRFFCSNPNKCRIILSIYHHTGGLENIPLGDTILKIKDFQCNDEHYTEVMELVHPETGKKVHGPNGKTTLELMIKMEKFCDARREEHQLVFEYQRWNPTNAWGDGNLLMTDKGPWVTTDGKTSSKSLETLLDPIPSDWIVSDNWYTIGTKDDPDGWQYAADFHSTFWYPVMSSGCYVRRRLWNRALRKLEDDLSNSSSMPRRLSFKDRAKNLLNSMVGKKRHK